MRILRGVLALLGAGVVLLVASLHLAAADVTITNAGSAVIPVRGRLPAGAAPLLAVLGVRNLPDELAPGTPATIRLPSSLGGAIDAQQPGTIAVEALGQTLRFDAACDTLTLDGSSLLGQRTLFSVGSRAAHEVRVSCR
jgi:hypothetical protein